MPDSLRPLTVAVCTADTHCAIDLTLPANMHIGQLLPQIVDIVHPDAEPDTARDWRLSRLGDPPMDESMTLNDNDVRAGDVLVLTTVEPPAAEWVDYDPCHTIAAAGTAVAPVVRILPAICCVLLGGFGAVALVLPARVPPPPAFSPARVWQSLQQLGRPSFGAFTVTRWHVYP
ncbi:MAG: EsaB/YukD family protein [Mycobacterium sp.]